MSQKILDKADKYLCEGRVTVLKVDVAAGDALVEVRGTEPYKVRFVGVWTCDCPSRVDRCAHVVAAEKIVNMASASVHLGEKDPDIDFLLGT